MKAIGLPPSDPRVSQMNDAQWLWCYFNEVQDEKEEADSWKSRFDYLTYFINFDMAKSVHEMNGNNSRKSKYQQDGLHGNSQFNKEMRAATLGYDPSSGLSVDEFLQSKLQSKEKSTEGDTMPDLMNDSFEELLAGGGFVEVADASQGIGNAKEHVDDFLDRAFEDERRVIMQDQLKKQEQLRKQEMMKDAPIGIEEEDWDKLNSSDDSHSPSNKEVQKTDEELIRESEEQDLDIFDFDD